MLERKTVKYNSTYGPPRLQRMARPVCKGFCRDSGRSVCFNVSGLEELALPAKMEIRAFRAS